MHVIPGNVVDAGVAEIIGLFDDRWGSLHDRLLDIGRQAVEHARAAWEETAAAVVMGRTGAAAGPGAPIGLARASPAARTSATALRDAINVVR